MTDATGAVLPGVTVVVKNVETNVAREAITDGAASNTIFGPRDMQIGVKFSW